MAESREELLGSSEVVELVSFLLALNGVFMTGYILFLLPERGVTPIILLRLLPEIATAAVALTSAYGLQKMKPWGFSTAIFSIGMIAHSVLGQLSDYTWSQVSLLYWLVPLGIITAAVYFWRREIFMTGAPE